MTSTGLGTTPSCPQMHPDPCNNASSSLCALELRVPGSQRGCTQPRRVPAQGWCWGHSSEPLLNVPPVPLAALIRFPRAPRCPHPCGLVLVPHPAHPPRAQPQHPAGTGTPKGPSSPSALPAPRTHPAPRIKLSPADHGEVQLSSLPSLLSPLSPQSLSPQPGEGYGVGSSDGCAEPSRGSPPGCCATERSITEQIYGRQPLPTRSRRLQAHAVPAAFRG